MPNPTRMMLFSLTLMAMGIGHKTNAMTTESNDKALLEQTYAEMYRAMIAKDTAALGRLLAEDFVLVHMTGMRQSKAEYLQAIARGTLNYYACDDTRLEASTDGTSARMTGCSRVEAAVFGGGRHTWPLRLDIALRKQEGRWLMTEIRAGTY